MKKAEMIRHLELLKADQGQVEKNPLVPAVARRMLARSVALLEAILDRIPNDAPKTD